MNAYHLPSTKWWESRGKRNGDDAVLRIRTNEQEWIRKPVISRQKTQIRSPRGRHPHQVWRTAELSKMSCPEVAG